jgi:hypothetical protein
VWKLFLIKEIFFFVDLGAFVVAIFIKIRIMMHMKLNMRLREFQFLCDKFFDSSVMKMCIFISILFIDDYGGYI